MSLWRLHVRPDSDEGSNPVEVCVSKKIVGIGWRVGQVPASKDEYWTLGRDEYAKPGQKGRKGWAAAANALLHRLAPDDLVWFRSLQGVYYLARITGDWRYSTDPDCNSADLFNVRDAEMYEVGAVIAGKIISCFRPNATIQSIANSTADAFSRVVFNQLAGREHYGLGDQFVSADVFDLLTDVELEDVVGLYLQLEADYVVIPSSRSRRNDTPYYEYQLISRSTAESAFVQVKSGDERLDCANYSSFKYRMFLFSPAGYVGTPSRNTVTLSRDTIEDFMNRRAEMLPLSVRAWLDFRARLATKNHNIGRQQPGQKTCRG
jgi:hypothetical protein